MPHASDSKLESLRKILEREEATGFHDTTVIGGLDRFLSRWARELAPAVDDRGELTGPTSQKSVQSADHRGVGEAGGLLPLEDFSERL